MKVRLAALMIALSLWMPPGTTAESPPARVPPMRMEFFSPDRYQRLASEWKRFAAAHPRDGEAWAQLARASYYANEPCKLVLDYARRAVRESPGNAEALAALGRFGWAVYCDGGSRDPAQSIRLLERALEIDPFVDDAHYHLWVMLAAAGRRQEADRHLRVLLDEGRMPEPLVDFGHNLLVGLEPNAILVTNGDNDTYPTLALQVARGFRTDVTVVNIGLLNLLWYRRALASGPRAIPVPELANAEFGAGGPDAMQGLIAKLKSEGWKRPFYLAVTVECSRLKLEDQLSLEGLVYRVKNQSGAMVTDVPTLELNLDQRYRRESCTSAAVDWKRWPALAMLARNYAAADWQLAQALAKGGKTARSREVMERLLALCDQQKADDSGLQFLEAWRQWDARAPRLVHWQKRFSH